MPLPEECLWLIVSYLRHDRATLYSLLLTSKPLFRISASFLYASPFRLLHSERNQHWTVVELTRRYDCLLLLLISSSGLLQDKNNLIPVARTDKPQAPSGLPPYGPEVPHLPSPATVDYLCYSTDMYHDPMIHGTFMTLFPTIPNCYRDDVVWYRSMVEIRNRIELAMLDRLAPQLTTLTISLPLQVPRIKLPWLSSLRRLEILGAEYGLYTDSDLGSDKSMALANTSRSNVDRSVVTRLDKMLMFIQDHQQRFGTLRELRIDCRPVSRLKGQLNERLIELVEVMGDCLEVLDMRHWPGSVLYLDQIPIKNLRTLLLHTAKLPEQFLPASHTIPKFLGQCPKLREISMYTDTRDIFEAWRPEHQIGACGTPSPIIGFRAMTALTKIELAGVSQDVIVAINDAAELFAITLEHVSVRSWFNGKLAATPLSWRGTLLPRLESLDLEGEVAWTFDYQSLLGCLTLARTRLAFTGPMPSRSSQKQPAIDTLARIFGLQELELVGKWETLNNKGWPSVISRMHQLERLDLVGCEGIKAEQIIRLIQDIIVAKEVVYLSHQAQLHSCGENYGRWMLRWVITGKQLEDANYRLWQEYGRSISGCSSFVQSAYQNVRFTDPSALESLSSVLTGVSSYVANTLPTSFSMPTRGFTSPSNQDHQGNPNSTHPYHSGQSQHANPLLGQENVYMLTNGDAVRFSAFDWIDSGDRNKSTRRFCLLLGYVDGFQIWDITHPDNIHEIVSVREKENDVSFIKVLPTPRIPAGKVDQFEQDRPLLAIISHKSNDGIAAQRKLQIYSLTSHQIIKTIDFGDGPDDDVSALDINERGLVVALSSPGENTKLHLLNQLTLNPLYPKQSVLNDASTPGVIVLGTRLLAYVTTSEAPNESSDSKSGDLEGDGTSGYQDLAKGVAKEVFGGVKMLGGFAHQTISSYWSGRGTQGPTSMASTSPPTGTNGKMPHRHSRRTSASIDPDRVTSQALNRRRHDDNVHNTSHKKEAIGSVIIRDISLAGMPVVAHFKPHDHPISGCKFSPSGRLLLTVSRHGNVFHIHEVRSSSGSGTRHLYKLARGITHATVEDIVFNEDETWVAVTTSRGTTHLYAINPFGGSPDVGAHMYSGVVNWTATAIEYPTSLNALCRIKQRHYIPDIIVSAGSAMDDVDSPHMHSPQRQSASLNRHNSQDSVSSSGTSTSEYSQGHLPHPYVQSSRTGGRQRSNMSAYFLPSSTVFASDPRSVALSPGEYEDGQDGPLGSCSTVDVSARRNNASHGPATHSSNLLINRAKAPPVSTTARLQSTASHLWQTLSPPAAAVVQHAAHGLASLPGLVVESSRRGPVATVRSRTMSWTGANSSPGPAKQAAPQAHPNHGTHNAVNSESDVPLAVQQQLASQGSLVEPERGPSFADIYVFSPLGMLTLHRCWVSSVRSKKNYNGRVVETSDLMLAPEDVAEWTLNRSGDWSPVKKPLAKAGSSKSMAPMAGTSKHKKSNTSHSHWLAQAEISTYDNGMHSGWKGQYPLLQQTLAVHGNSTVTLTQPQHLLWKSPQFSFQTYIGTQESIAQEFHEGKLPATKTLNLRRGIAVVAGNGQGRSSSRQTSGNRPWISGIAVSADGGGVRGHGRVESHDGDTDDLSENLSSAMKTYLKTHSSSPINQSRMSPSIGSISPSSLRAATLSFEDAYLINLGNASVSPKTAFFGANQGYNGQQTFMSTTPTDHAAKSRSGSSTGSSLASGANGAPSVTNGAFVDIPSSTASPVPSPLNDKHSPHDQFSGRTNQPKVGFSTPTNGAGAARPIKHRGQQGSRPNSLQAQNVMAQSTLMMFSPDGDNEVDMPGSASIFVGGNTLVQDGLEFEPHRNSASQSSGSTTLPQGGVFHLDDDDFLMAPRDTSENGYNPKTQGHILKHHYGSGSTGVGSSHSGQGGLGLDHFLEQDEERLEGDDDDDTFEDSLI
ncbi:Breast carcinoma amplified sequence 3 [Podila humilis]|nr:Breast carcinoma amplified sequence 3 [Podila humilis]